TAGARVTHTSVRANRMLRRRGRMTGRDVEDIAPSPLAVHAHTMATGWQEYIGRLIFLTHPTHHRSPALECIKAYQLATFAAAPLSTTTSKGSVKATPTTARGSRLRHVLGLCAWRRGQ